MTAPACATVLIYRGRGLGSAGLPFSLSLHVGDLRLPPAQTQEPAQDRGRLWRVWETPAMRLEPANVRSAHIQGPHGCDMLRLEAPTTGMRTAPRAVTHHRQIAAHLPQERTTSRGRENPTRP